MRFIKLFAAAAATAGLCAVMGISAAAESDVISVAVDNDLVSFDQPPIIIDPGYTMVPIRAVFEQAGATVDWDQDTQTASIVKDGITVTIQYGDTAMYRNGERIELDAPAIMQDEPYRLLIPLRAISEAMDYAVTWDGHHSLALISTTGKPYRAYAFIKKGFRTLEDAAEFYTTGAANATLDLDGDGTLEDIAFRPADELSSDSKVLTINGMDYTASLGSLTSVYSIAFVDLDDTDNIKELIVTENGDVLTAHFYRYDKGIMKFITDGAEANAEVAYASNLLISGKSYVLSDLYGTCFVDIMVSGGMHVYQSGQSESDKVLKLTKFQSISSIFGRNLYKTYEDGMLYHVIYTQNYTPGAYMYINDTGIINSNDLTHFKLLDGFITEEDKTYIELFVELPNGETAVIKPYKI